MMKLSYDLQAHAAGSTPEYDVDVKNIFQEFAALTHGVATPGNALTGLGFAANIQACKILRSGNVSDGTLSGQQLVQACDLLAVDGFFDLLDGAAAKATKTRSPLGRRADAGTDPIRTLNSFHALWQCGILSDSVALTLGMEKAVTILPSIVANIRGNEPVVASASKALTAVQRSTAGFYLMSAMFEQLALETVTDMSKRERYGAFAIYAHGMATTSFAGSVALAIPASLPYINAAMGARQEHVQT